MRDYNHLTRLYILALSIIACLLVSAYLIMNHAINRQTHDATIINISGRQRMLSQRMALLSAQLIYPEKREEIKSKLLAAVNEMERAHKALTRGDKLLSLPNVRSAAISGLYFNRRIPFNEEGKTTTINLDELMLHYFDEVHEILRLDDSALVPGNKELAHVVNDYHDVLLPLLNEVVNMYEKESLQRVHDLQKLELAALVFALFVIGLEVLFIFRPMIRGIEAREKALILANKRIEIQKHQEKLAALGELSGGLAHEINNALQPILGLSQVLRNRMKDQHNEELYELVSNLEKGARHARAIVQSVLAYARNYENEFAQIHAVKILQEAIAFSRTFLPSSIEIKISDNLNPAMINAEISCDRTNIMQIFVNLFKNAADAMDQKGVISLDVSQGPISEKEAEILDLPVADYLCVTVSDTGHGMKEEDLARACDPFFTTKLEGQGTGLGLSTVFGIMRQHAGAVRIESAENHGTTVSLYFPVSSHKIDEKS